MAFADLTERVSRQDPNAVSSDLELIQDLIGGVGTWLEGKTRWRLQESGSRILYHTGGVFTIRLPQPGTVSLVEVRYGSSWDVRLASDYEVIGTEGLDLVLRSGEPWPGRKFSFIRTPGRGSGDYLTSHPMGTSRVRVTLDCGFSSADDWPKDLLMVLAKVVSRLYKGRSLSRSRSSASQDEEIRSTLEPMDWQIINYYADRGKVLAA